jgi:hypothetical protein
MSVEEPVEESRGTGGNDNGQYRLGLSHDLLSEPAQAAFEELKDGIHEIVQLMGPAEDEVALKGNALCQAMSEKLDRFPELAQAIHAVDGPLLLILLREPTPLGMFRSQALNECRHKASKLLIEKYPDILSKSFREQYMLTEIAEDPELLIWVATNYMEQLDKEELPDFPPHFRMLVNAGDTGRYKLTVEHLKTFYEDLYPPGLFQVDAGGNTILHIICSDTGLYTLFEWFAERHPQAFTIQTSRGKTPLHIACDLFSEVMRWTPDDFRCHLNAINYMIRHAPDSVRIRDNHNGLPLTDLLLTYTNRSSVQNIVLGMLRRLQYQDLETRWFENTFVSQVYPLLQKEYCIVQEYTKIEITRQTLLKGSPNSKYLYDIYDSYNCWAKNRDLLGTPSRVKEIQSQIRDVQHCLTILQSMNVGFFE